MRVRNSVLAGATLIMFASPALAAELQYIYVGHVDPATNTGFSPIDVLGLFGPANADLSGLGFKAVELFDSTGVGPASLSISIGTGSQFTGGGQVTDFNISSFDINSFSFYDPNGGVISSSFTTYSATGQISGFFKDNVGTSGPGDYIGLIGTSATMSVVPLPSSLPLFGGALLALIGLSYRVNRRVNPKEKSGAVA